jgi:hypothetical protein
MPCQHKTLFDHTERSDAALIWCCSACGLTSWWGDTWGYLGNMECRDCQTAQVDFVWCSEECRKQLMREQPAMFVGVKDMD